MATCCGQLFAMPSKSYTLATSALPSSYTTQLSLNIQLDQLIRNSCRRQYAQVSEKQADELGRRVCVGKCG